MYSDNNTEIEDSEISCGVSQLFSLNNEPVATISDIAEYVFTPDELDGAPNFTFLIFSDCDKKDGLSNGQKLAQYIRDKRLGSIVASRARINPNTENKIRVWIWGVSFKALEKFYKIDREEINENEND